MTGDTYPSLIAYVIHCPTLSEFLVFKQPIKQSVIIKIRGNKSYDHIKKFRQLGLIVGKRTGHTLDLSLSEEFYEYFNVAPSNNSSENKTKEEISQ